MTFSRRKFLAWSGVAAGAGALAAGGGYAWTHPDVLRQAAIDSPLDPRSGVLVLVTLYGGNDGLNTVIPAADRAYQDARPDLAYQPGEVLDLGDGLGLNPAMKGLKSLWDSKELAIVRGVGYPQPDRSHFRSMAIWQTADPRTPQPSGWLGRWLDATGDPLQAVSVEPVLPPVLVGSRTAAASCPPKGLQLGKGPTANPLAMLGRPDPADCPLQAAAARSLSEVARIGAALDPSAARAREEAQAPQGQGSGTGTGGQQALEQQLDLVAAMIELGVPSQVYSVSLGGFDTHAGEKASLEGLLGHLSDCLSRFQQRLNGTERGKQVVTMVHSEFGRRVRANGSDGTDHGTAGPMFLMGRGVRPGFHGDQPSLTDLDNGDLKSNLDFRQVYANLLTRVLDADPARFLAGFNKELPVIS
ncbi:hypothetical protein CGZ96_09765 [Enemella evansiae]|uniref:DUF1501 domain-containing protein n=1 Tax=Enemella evansiae TaxID=2016499 RepID=UPI000B95EF25|nr:DUF1501 domain-containing protein [Enemella evansiae]OYN98493.1 hypothetical protein CGZ96_09765 [Enemella evansiae]